MEVLQGIVLPDLRANRRSLRQPMKGLIMFSSFITHIKRLFSKDVDKIKLTVNKVLTDIPALETKAANKIESLTKQLDVAKAEQELLAKVKAAIKSL